MVFHSQSRKFTEKKLLTRDAGLEALCKRYLRSLATDSLINKIKVFWNNRLVTSAGLARLDTYSIELNPLLLEHSYKETLRTLKHELAHLIVYVRYGDRRSLAPHGKEWRQACCDVGIPGETASHDLFTRKRKQKTKYLYICPHCQTHIERVRKIKTVSACYICCRKHNRGQYDPRFKLKEIRLDTQPIPL